MSGADLWKAYVLVRRAQPIVEPAPQSGVSRDASRQGLGVDRD